jgi:hypothetical protein
MKSMIRRLALTAGVAVLALMMVFVALLLFAFGI